MIGVTPLASRAEAGVEWRGVEWRGEVRLKSNKLL